MLLLRELLILGGTTLACTPSPRCCANIKQDHEWEYLTSDEGKTVLAAVRNLVPRAQLSGVVTDEEISNELRELNIPRREISSIAINAQRALWLNQDGVLLLPVRARRGQKTKAS